MKLRLTAKTLTAPRGMSGLACEPWTQGEIYAVAANWAEANSPVLAWGEGEGEWTQTGRQVADYSHRPIAALRKVVENAIRMSGEPIDDDEVSAIIEDAVECRSHDLGEMCDMLERHGEAYAGNCTDDEAQDWIDHDFTVDEADAWCEIGVWDSSTASRFRAAGKTPEQIAAAAQSLIDAEDDPISVYTSGDPIYAACNNDLSPQTLIDACED